MSDNPVLDPKVDEDSDFESDDFSSLTELDFLDNDMLTANDCQSHKKRKKTDLSPSAESSLSSSLLFSHHSSLSSSATKTHGSGSGNSADEDGEDENSVAMNETEEEEQEEQEDEGGEDEEEPKDPLSWSQTLRQEWEEVHTTMANDPTYKSVETRLEVLQKQMHDTVDCLVEKYRKNPYMLPRLVKHVNLTLPDLMEQMRLQREQTLAKQVERKHTRKYFVATFLNHYAFYYAPITRIFVWYEEQSNEFLTKSEDEVMVMILDAVVKVPALTGIKYAICQQIIRFIISNRTIFQMIPDREAIQYALQTLSPAVFTSRVMAKYFLTILGDSMMRKDCSKQVFHMVPSGFLDFVQYLHCVSVDFTGVSSCRSFRCKNRAYDFAQLRVLTAGIHADFLVTASSPTTATAASTSLSERFDKASLHWIMVACHYSNRFESSDHFLHTVLAEEAAPVRDQVLFFTQRSPESLVESFVGEYLIVCGNNDDDGVAAAPAASSLTWRNMLYLWKEYLRSHQIPSLIAHNRVHELLCAFPTLSALYSEVNDQFVGVTSRFLPRVQMFLRFWQETISVVVDPSSSSSTPPAENPGAALDLSEINLLLQSWCRRHALPAEHLSETVLRNLITHFFEDGSGGEPRSGSVVQWGGQDQRTLVGVTSNEWDKAGEVIQSFRNYMQTRFPTRCISSAAGSGTGSATEGGSHHFYFEKYMSVDAYAFYCNAKKNERNSQNPATAAAAIVCNKAYYESVLSWAFRSL